MIIINLCLDQIVDFPTRYTAIFYLIFTNRPDIAKTPKLLARLGDHEAVSLQPLKKNTKREILLQNKADKTKLIHQAMLRFSVQNFQISLGVSVDDENDILWQKNATGFFEGARKQEKQERKTAPRHPKLNFHKRQ